MPPELSGCETSSSSTPDSVGDAIDDQVGVGID